MSSAPDPTRRSQPDSDSDTDARPHPHPHPHTRVKSGLAAFEQDSTDRAPWKLNRAELKLLGIAGVGFFLDAYDLFIINPVATMLQFRLYGGAPLPTGLEGFLKAGANIGSVIGQFLFGYLADSLGRSAIYGKELMLIIFATIMAITTPTGVLSPASSLLYLTIFRIILGIGVGGDYPMSASVASDRASVRRRGTLLAYVFANQGWGSFVGSVVVMAVLAAYRGAMGAGTRGVDGVWRIAIGVSLVPAFGTLYQRLTLPESTRYERSREAGRGRGRGEAEVEADADASSLDAEKNSKKAGDADLAPKVEERSVEDGDTSGAATKSKIAKVKETAVQKKAHHREFIAYFSEWRHGKILIGTSMCWFLLDVAFYGINLNQNVVLQQIGFDGTEGTPWERLFRIATGNLIITALGFVPGYYATVLTIEVLGRKTIQLMGFLMTALFLAILAGKFDSLETVPFIVCFALLQFFFNFGANTTTYCYPAEVFPTRFKASAHGLSAASGKAGAILSALAFNTLSRRVGTPAVLWIFFACCIAGAGFTLLLPEVKGRDADLIDEEEMRGAGGLHV